MQIFFKVSKSEPKEIHFIKLLTYGFISVAIFKRGISFEL